MSLKRFIKNMKIKFFDEFEKAYKEYENKVKERRARGIHDYNVFDVLETKEVKHSKFIASLLDPKGLHYQGDLFLREFVKICVPKDFEFDTSNAQVFREYENIDIYITDGNKHIIIENKICDANDQDKQIYWYIETIKDTMLELRIMKYVKYDPETNMLLAGPKPYDEWDEEIIEDLHRKAKNKKDKER